MSNEVFNAAAEHTELLQSLRAVDYAPPTLAQVKQQFSGIQEELGKEKKNVAKLEASTKKEFKDWQGIKERTSKRIWTKIAHPSSHKEILTEKEAKEEKEYLEALTIEQSTKARIQEYERQVGQMQQDISQLEPIAAHHQQLKQQLDALYERVFGGPTPAYPEEDAAEQKLQQTLQQFNNLQTSITNEKRALQLLQQADQMMIRASKSIGDAESASTWDMWGGGTMADMMERSALADAQRYGDQARMLVMQAQRLQPMIQDLQGLEMPQGNIWGDVIFDNIFTDMAFHEKIQKAARQTKQVHIALRGIVGQSKSHLEGLEGQGKGAAGEMEYARETLEGLRRGIIERVAVPPPSYS